jgi:hypothetical protein
MTYGQRSCAPATNRLVEQALARAAGSWGAYQAWRQLDEDGRLALIDQTLKPTIDDYPLAL